MTTWNPEDYSRSSSQQQKWARQLIAKLSLRGDERILDIGCGDGKVTAEIAQHVPRGTVVGIDSSEEMIRFAASAHPRERFANLSFCVMDACRMDFVESFDAVFSNAVLHWITDHRPVLRGMERALVAGGRALLQMGGVGNAADILSVVEHMMADGRWRDYFASFTFRYGFYGPQEYRQWLEEAGLEPVRVELIPKDMVHDGSAGLAAWFRTTWMPYIEPIPRNLRGAFIDESIGRYTALHPVDAAGKVHLRMVRLEVEAAKSTPRVHQCAKL